MPSPIHSFDPQGFQNVMEDLDRLERQFSEFRRAELPSAVRTEVSHSLDEALFGKNSAINAHVSDLQEAVRNLPNHEQVKNMMNDALSPLHVMSQSMAALNANVENLVSTANRIESKLVMEDRVKVLIHEEAKSTIRWICGIVVATAGVLFAGLRYFAIAH